MRTKPRMPDIISIRLSEAGAPDRGERFDAAVSTGGATPTNVLRAMIDAYILFVEENGRVPNLPLRVVEINPPPGK